MAAAVAGAVAKTAKAFVRPRLVPAPRGNIDAKTFLKTIGRECDKHAEQLGTWEALFTSDTTRLRELGVKTQQRKWILTWTEKYRQGIDPYNIPLRPKISKAEAAKAASAAKGGKK